MPKHCSSVLHLIYHLHPKEMEDDAGKMLLIKTYDVDVKNHIKCRQRLCIAKPAKSTAGFFFFLLYHSSF